MIGNETTIEGQPAVTVGPDQTRELRVLVTVMEDSDDEHEPPHLEFTITDTSDGRHAVGRDFFRTPHTVH